MNTDKLLLEALERCATANGCRNCEYADSTDCAGELAALALDLIKLQRAEIERLQAGEYRYIGKIVQNARTEAIEDFVEKLKEKSEYCYMGNINALTYRITAKDLERIVKEMTEVKHESI